MSFFGKLGSGLKKVGGVVAKAAPFIATAVSVADPAAMPFVQAAATLLGQHLNTQVDPTADAITSTITQAAASTDPAQLNAVRAADQQFALQLKTLGVDSEEAFSQMFLTDTASAREMEVKTGDVWTPRILTLFIMTLAGVIVYKVLQGTSVALKDPVVSMTVGTVIGFVFGDVKQIIAFYFGSSRASDDKNATIMQLAQNGNGK
jgi:hypothetical protein